MVDLSLANSEGCALPEVVPAVALFAGVLRNKILLAPKKM